MGQLHEAILNVDPLQGIGLSSNVYFFLLQKCIDAQDLAAGMEVYSLIVTAKLEVKSYLGSQLIQMFYACGCLMEANDVFMKLSMPNVFAWGVIILANAKLGQSNVALALYEQMKQSVVQPDGHVFVAILNACASMAALSQGKAIHLQTMNIGFDLCDVYLGNALIDMYAKCGSVQDAQRIFDNLPKRDLVTWTVIISGLSQQGQANEAFQIFQRMKDKGIKPDDVTYASLLKACSTADHGDLIYNSIIENDEKYDAFVGSTLIHMYIVCGRMDDAMNVFDKAASGCSVVAWNTMIAGYVANGHVREAFGLFQVMQDKKMKPDKVTFVNLMKAGLIAAESEYCAMVTACVRKCGFELDAMVGSVLLHTYSKTGNLEGAHNLFNNMMHRDVVTWTTMVGCYAENGYDQVAISLFDQMHQEGVEPNHFTFVCVLKACSTIASLNKGKLLHQDVVEHGFETALYVGNALIDMYIKCRRLKDAQNLFAKLAKRDVVTWNNLIAGYAQSGEHATVLELFSQMEGEDLKPNSATYIPVLSACTHLGLVEKGCHHYNVMTACHGINPSLDHYNCMVDLLGRAGNLPRSEDILQALPYQCNLIGWRSLLNHCKTHESVQMGRKCFDYVVSLDGRHSAGYMPMASMYNVAGLSEDAGNIEALRELAKAWNLPGTACVKCPIYM